MTDEYLNEATNRYRLLRVALEHFKCEPTALTDEQHQQALRIVNNQVQIERMVLRSSEAAGVIVSDAQIEEALERIAAQHDDPSAMDQALTELGMDKDQLRQMLHAELRMENVLERICADLPPITDAEIQDYYQTNIERFTRPPSRRTRHILVTINPDYPENTREAARTRIEAIAHRLEGKIQNFEKQAAKYSECPTAMEGGLLGEVTPGKLYPELDSYLFQMQAGQVSPVLESPIGFHLLLCEQITPGGASSLEEVQPRLLDWLQSRQRQIRQREWLKALLQQSVSEKVHG